MNRSRNTDRPPTQRPTACFTLDTSLLRWDTKLGLCEQSEEVTSAPAAVLGVLQGHSPVVCACLTMLEKEHPVFGNDVLGYQSIFVQRQAGWPAAA